MGREREGGGARERERERKRVREKERERDAAERNSDSQENPFTIIRGVAWLEEFAMSIFGRRCPIYLIFFNRGLYVH